jgi:uncharacterized membrane protein
MKENITEKETFKYYTEKYPPNGYTRFMYKWFNVNTFTKPYPVGAWLAILCFFVGSTGMIIEDQKGNRKKATKWVYVLMGFFILIFTLPAYWMNQSRIRRLCADMGISIEKYNELIDKYPENK